MPKYLIQVNYSAEGTRGLLEDGGSRRVAAAEKAIRSVGGKVEAFYFAFGDADAYVIIDMPDHASASALALTINASGAVACRTTVLLTPDEVDKATKKKPKYRAPGK